MVRIVKHTVEAHSDGDGLPLLAKIKDKNSCMLDHPDTQGTSYWNSLYKKKNKLGSLPCNSPRWFTG